MKRTGATMVVEALASEGVRHVFGIPGGSVIPLYDALYDATFAHVLVRHEQAAAHCADGYARIMGRPGVCLCTSGPGFTNILTGLATAFMDSVPLVVITGQVATGLIGTDAFQEADTFGCSLPVVKHSFLVRTVEEILPAIKGAFEIASSGRPGPVVVDLPVDLQRAEGDFPYPSEPVFPPEKLRPHVDLARLDRAVALLESAKRPVILAGGGVLAARASRALVRLAERLDIPVATTLMGKGAISGWHGLSLGMAGMHGTPWANLALSEADVLLAVGTRFSDRTTGRLGGFAGNATVIHADLDEAEIDKNVRCDVPLVGNAEAILSELADRLAPQTRDEWTRTVRGWMADYPIVGGGDGAFTPASIFAAVQEAANPDWPVATDVGQNQMWTALFYRVAKPGTFLTSGGLGTMGYGLPAAMGAALASGGPALCFAGDGGFLMNCQELETCARYNIPVKVILLHNDALGMVRQWQELFWKERYSATVPGSPCRFDRLAEALGVPGFTCGDAGGLRAALTEAFALPGPALVECRIPQGELVFPMVPAGATLRDFIRNRTA